MAYCENVKVNLTMLIIKRITDACDCAFDWQKQIFKVRIHIQMQILNIQTPIQMHLHLLTNLLYVCDKQRHAL